MYFVDNERTAVYVLSDDIFGAVTLTGIYKLSSSNQKGLCEVTLPSRSLSKLYKQIPRLRVLLLGVQCV